jgi:hypothetical protein
VRRGPTGWWWRAVPLRAALAAAGAAMLGTGAEAAEAALVAGVEAEAVAAGDGPGTAPRVWCYIVCGCLQSVTGRTAAVRGKDTKCS